MSFITFIIPSINRPSLIRAIESVHAQTYTDWKIIIVFDGIKNTVLQNYDTNKITVIEAAKMKSPGGMRNIGMNLVDSKWIGFLDDDDILYDRYIEELMKEDERYLTIGFVLFRMLCNKIVPNMNIKDKILLNEAGISFAVKTEIVKQFNMKFDLRGSEDYNFLNTLVKKNVKFKISNYVAYEVCKSHRDKGEKNDKS